MKKTALGVALATFLFLPVMTTTQGCGLVRAPIAPPTVTNTSNAWASAKIAYGSAFGLFRSYVFTLCPPTAEQLEHGGAIPCPDTLTDYERKTVGEGQVIHAEAAELMATGDALAGGDLSPIVARLNELIALLNRRAAGAGQG